MDHTFSGKPVNCLVNAEVGHEAELSLTSDAKTAGTRQEIHRVLVIGAGPAGLEYARVVASRGHKVTIWEETDQPGGQLFLAAAPPVRKDFLHLATYLANACKNLEVEIQYSVKATSENILVAVKAEKFNKVVIATGACPISPNIPIEEGVKVVQAWDVLAGRSETGKNVIIVGGGSVGVETALLLAECGTLDNETLRFLILQQAETPSD